MSVAYIHVCEKCKIIYKSWTGKKPCPKCSNTCFSSTSLEGECPLMFHSCFELNSLCIYKNKESVK